MAFHHRVCGPCLPFQPHVSLTVTWLLSQPLTLSSVAPESGSFTITVQLVSYYTLRCVSSEISPLEEDP